MKFILKENIYDFVAILLLVSLSFSKALPNIFLGILFLLFLLNKSRKKYFFYFENYFIIIALLFFYLILKALLFQSLIIDIQYYSKYFLILLTTLVLLKVNRNRLILGFLLSVLISIIIASVNIFSFYLNHKKFPFEDGAIINKILVVERPYFGFICLLAIILSVYISSIFKKYKLLFYIFASIAVAFIFFIAARLSLISLVLILLIYIFFYSTLSIVKKLSIIIAGILILSFTLTSYKNLTNRFFTNTTKDKLQLYDPRVVIWSCAYEISSADNFNAVFGVESYSWLESQFRECYSHKNNDDLERKEWFIKQGFNSHNQFIDIYLIGGILGLFIFTAFVGNLLYISKNNFLISAVAFSLFLFFILENVLHRQFGCYLIAFVLAIVSPKLKTE